MSEDARTTAQVVEVSNYGYGWGPLPEVGVVRLAPGKWNIVQSVNPDGSSMLVWINRVAAETPS